MKNTKYSQEEVYDDLFNKGYILIGEYINANEKMDFVDKDGYKYSFSYSALKSGGYNPRFVHTKNIYSLDNIKSWIARNGVNVEVLSSKYEGSHSKLKCKCLIHGVEWAITWADIQSGYGCPVCGNEKIGNSLRYNINFVKDFLFNNCPTTTIVENEQYVNKLSGIKCKCTVCDNIWDTNWGNIERVKGRCPSCSIKKGESHYNWNGGISTLTDYLRTVIQPWKNDSFKRCKGKCDVTKRKGDVVHHIYNFSDIVKESMEALGFEELKCINEYSPDDLKAISDTCLELHYKYGLGVCLCDDVHKKFHNIYGTSNNTLEQYLYFKNNFKFI